jgi:hypothetical protein
VSGIWITLSEVVAVNREPNRGSLSAARCGAVLRIALRIEIDFRIAAAAREKASSATPAVAKPEQPEPSKGKLYRKEVYAGVRFPTRSPDRVRQVGGLSLRDYLGTR